MSKENDMIKDLLKSKQDTEKLTKSTYYLTEVQREKLERYAKLTKRGKSEFLRDILDRVFEEMEKEEADK